MSCWMIESWSVPHRSQTSLADYVPFDKGKKYLLTNMPSSNRKSIHVLRDMSYSYFVFIFVSVSVYCELLFLRCCFPPIHRCWSRWDCPSRMGLRFSSCFIFGLPIIFLIISVSCCSPLSSWHRCRRTPISHGHKRILVLHISISLISRTSPMLFVRASLLLLYDSWYVHYWSASIQFFGPRASFACDHCYHLLFNLRFCWFSRFDLWPCFAFHIFQRKFWFPVAFSPVVFGLHTEIGTILGFRMFSYNYDQFPIDLLFVPALVLAGIHFDFTRLRQVYSCRIIQFYLCVVVDFTLLQKIKFWMS